MTPQAKKKFMNAALEEARKGWGKTHPQAMIGAVLVEANRIAAKACVEHAGPQSIEQRLFQSLGREPKEKSTLLVTLEPGPSSNRMESGVSAIVNSGVKEVIIGALDPVPDHEGKGAQALKDAGLKVETRVLIEDCQDLNLIFNHWVKERQPLLAAKSAATLDGKIACRSGDSKWITGEAARQNVMMWRRLFPAIGVGAGTVIEDDPRLTSRVEGQDEWCGVRFVIDGLLRTAMDRYLPALYTDDFRDNTIVVTTDAAGTGYIRRLESEGVTVWVLPAVNMKVPFQELRKKCYDVGICGIYFEGGSKLNSELMHHKQLDYHFNYRAPIIIGDDKAKPAYRGFRVENLSQTLRLENVRHETFDEDQLIRGFVAYPSRLDVDETIFSHE